MDCEYTLFSTSNLVIDPYLVKTPPANPNSVSLALLMASSSVSNPNMEATEPNTSSWAMVMSSRTSVTIHGLM